MATDLDTDRVVALLNRILEQELAGVVRYTHYSLLVFGYNRIPIVSWLREQASELRQIAESLPQLVWGCRPDGTCDYVSPQWTSYTGVPASELLGHGWLHAVDDRDRERVRRLWQSAVATETPMNVDLRLRAKDGSMRWFNARMEPIRAADGKVTKWYGSNSDIDDLKRAAERRRGEAIALDHREFGAREDALERGCEPELFTDAGDNERHLPGRRSRSASSHASRAPYFFAGAPNRSCAKRSPKENCAR